MRRKLFLHIVDSISFYDPWFIQKYDTLGRLELVHIAKVYATIHMFTHGLLGGAYDKYCRLGESIVLNA